jgi:hypothetical protein
VTEIDLGLAGGQLAELGEGFHVHSSPGMGRGFLYRYSTTDSVSVKISGV